MSYKRAPLLGIDLVNQSYGSIPKRAIPKAKEIKQDIFKNKPQQENLGNDKVETLFQMFKDQGLDNADSLTRFLELFRLSKLENKTQEDELQIDSSKSYSQLFKKKQKTGKSTEQRPFPQDEVTQRKQQIPNPSTNKSTNQKSISRQLSDKRQDSSVPPQTDQFKLETDQIKYQTEQRRLNSKSVYEQSDNCSTEDSQVQTKLSQMIHNAKIGLNLLEDKFNNFQSGLSPNRLEKIPFFVQSMQSQSQNQNYNISQNKEFGENQVYSKSQNENYGDSQSSSLVKNKNQKNQKKNLRPNQKQNQSQNQILSSNLMSEQSLLLPSEEISEYLYEGGVGNFATDYKGLITKSYQDREQLMQKLKIMEQSNKSRDSQIANLNNDMQKVQLVLNQLSTKKRQKKLQQQMDDMSPGKQYSAKKYPEVNSYTFNISSPQSKSNKSKQSDPLSSEQDRATTNSEKLRKIQGIDLRDYIIHTQSQQILKYIKSKE